jgi:hypothetical protein
MRRDSQGRGSQLDQVPVRIFDVGERNPRAVLSAPNQPAAGGFDFGDRSVEVGGIREAEPEVRHPGVYTGEPCFGGVLVEGDQVDATGVLRNTSLGPSRKRSCIPKTLL